MTDVKKEFKIDRKLLPPVALNFEYDTLLNAFKDYMKWHDYANFPWKDEFTSDNWLYIDTLADLPTKIDIRWMSKWGIFEFMKNKEIETESPVQDFVKMIEDSPANPKVTLDLKLACRFLQATGLHPYYVPIVAVAENINALTDERTLLRTGLINIYEYGAMHFEDLDSLMSNLTTVSYEVAYFDISKRSWDYGYINLPVMFLPPERRLLALRALFNRSLRIYRECLTELEKGYTEMIIEKDIMKEKMQTVIKAINTFFEKLSEEIVGKPYKLNLDETFVDAICESWNVAREVYTTRRIRSWVYRILGWLLYRGAYGYVRLEDLTAIINTLTEAAKLPENEAKTIREIAKLTVGIASRERLYEYIPTPLTLASMSEYVPLVRKFINEVFEAKGVPETWRPFWRQYINMRAIINEVREYVSRARQLYEYFIIGTEAVTKYLEEVTKYGYEPEEIKFMVNASDLERWYRAHRELIGTPRELASIVEYLPSFKEIALVEIERRVEALQVEEKLKEKILNLWKQYIDLREVIDEVRSVLSRVFQLYEYFIMGDDKFNAYMVKIRTLGFGDQKVQWMKERGMLERWYRAYRDLVGTIDELVTKTEYVPAFRDIAIEEVRKRIEALQEDEEFKNLLYRSWVQYIDIRPVIDEVRGVLSQVRQMYEYFVIDTDAFTSFLNVLKPYGYTDKELKLIIDRSNLERWYRAYRDLVGSPRELVTMAEYSPLARRLALAEVKKRIDALPIDREAKELLYKMWEDYIRIRPVYDEVEREVTELINDYASGALTWEEFNTLLEELKDWGIDEWEADAIRFIAMMRRRRYELAGYISEQI